jgi:hypothetical protein
MATEPDEGQPAAATDNASGGVAGSRPGNPASPPAVDTLERPPADPRRRVLLLAPIVAVIVGLVVAIANIPP